MVMVDYLSFVLNESAVIMLVSTWLWSCVKQAVEVLGLLSRGIFEGFFLSPILSVCPTYHSR
jgi:hypothetical protein